MNFGLITEGPTDQVVLKHLLARYFSDPDIDTRSVQPNFDSTDEVSHFGGWLKVLEYCKSPDMKIALEGYDFIIIQMDTDVCEEFGVKKREGGLVLPEIDIIHQIKSVIIQYIDNEIYQEFQHKIIFAISHESVECWLLPLYFENNVRNKTFNCCDTLNQELIKIKNVYLTTRDITIKKVIL